jgi:hypothetical protein
VYFNYQSKLAQYHVNDGAIETYLNGVEKEIAEYEAIERADTYGGNTPQETWALFVAALEVGDTELASKYFVQKRRGEMKRDFELGLSNGGREIQLNYFKTIKEERMQPDGKHFMYLTEPVKVEGIQGIDSLPFTYELEKSPISGLWKISDL